ncbi:MAG: carbonic anhydrase [Myxococcota bacterium]
MSIDPIYEGIQRFREHEFPRRREAFEALSSGQQPRLLLITCSDSRIDPALLTQTDPGDLFVVRNAGNLVPPSDAGPGGEAATIEYGIEALGIRDIAVCGHAHCGAMAALRDRASAAELACVPPWLEHAQPALARRVRVGDGQDPLTNTVGANVLAQLDNLRTHPFVARAIENDGLRLHGWVYDFVTGELYVSDEAGKFHALSGGATEDLAW